ncbi:glucan biosynthesis protein [Methylocaldum szegediense]|uniref:Glucans biosynthesis protein D n=1 Tax=Methylocaldum szegediense TaxID=73780 RepID=A0ABN8X403_9GAMM|nr:glucan biosynthesis protein D [Methylocaldum szegediense]CAI8862456.1 Glucans biosynthesis protein D 2 [Methylocaldum szegediense]
MNISRRNFLRLTLALNALSFLRTGTSFAARKTTLKLGAPVPFSFEILKALARERASHDYVAPPQPDPEIVKQIDYDAHGKLQYRKDAALWADGGSSYPVTFQHVGMFFPKTVSMNVVEKGMAREIQYDPNLFTIGPDHIASALPANPSAFAGFWVHENRFKKPDWKTREPCVTFLGASYFRAIGELGQVGLSARGIALNPGMSNPEEFPDFVSFWFEGARKADDPLIVYALLDGPSLSGAYRFSIKRTKGVIMDIEAELFLRKDIDRLGLAPLTSMYWFSETVKPAAVDWRPEVHDSDGLALWTGTGEHIWRPLNNPSRITVSSFVDKSPKGFGLLQRDRVFDHYQDGVRYHLRPSAWIEPLGDWGEGTVQLTEIPTDDEIHDNIVAMWVPREPATAGKSYHLRYRLHWLADEPYPTSLARCVATRLGNGGQPGKPRPKGVRKFTVEFMGKPLAKLPFGTKPEPVVTVSRGELSRIEIEAVPDGVAGHWRTHFDLAVAGTDPVEMRCYLRVKDKAMSETWLYQYHPA